MNMLKFDSSMYLGETRQAKHQMVELEFEWSRFPLLNQEGEELRVSIMRCDLQIVNSS